MNFLGPLLVACFLVETLLYFGAPHVYALVARLPFGPPRRLVVQPRAREALRAPAPEARGGYRDSAVGGIDLGRLELPERLETDGFVLHFHPARGFALARLPYTFSTRIFGMVRVDLRATDGALELRPRFVVLGWPTFLGLVPIATFFVFVTMRPSKWTGAFVMGALFVGINVVIGLLFARPRLEAGVDQVERQIQAALLSAEAGD